MNCDFCSSRAVRWIYPASDVAIVFLNDNNEIAEKPLVSTEEWMACDECHGLIEGDKRIALCDRATLLLSAAACSERPDLTAEACRAGIEVIHGAFWAARRGAAIHAARGEDG